MSTKKEIWYETVAVKPIRDGKYAVLLDDKPINTPKGNQCVAPSLSLADTVAAEWRGMTDLVDLKKLRTTSLLFAALDVIPKNRTLFENELTAYAETDLVCFRAEQPVELRAQQDELLEPICQWAEKTFGIELVRSEGIIANQQKVETVETCRGKLCALSPFELTAYSQLIRRAGSLFLALAVATKARTAEEAWILSRLEEDWQIAQWGEDDEARRAAENARLEFMTAAKFLELLGSAA